MKPMPLRARSRGFTNSPALVSSAIAVVALTAAQLFYQAGAASFRTVWAEDGEVFFDDARRRGLAALARPYAGYLVSLPRLLAFPATWLPAGRIAVYMAVAGALVCSLIAVSLYWLTDQAITSRVLRAVLVVAVALHPVLVLENMANITNVIWVLAFAVFWALLRQPIRRSDAVLAAVVVLLGTLSTSITVVFLPVAGYVAWTRRDRYTRIVVGAFGFALVVQGIAYLSTADHGPTGSAAGLPTLYVARVLGSAAVGEHWATQLWNDGGRTRLLPFAALIALVLLFLFVLTRGRALVLGIIAAAYSVIIFVAPLLNRGTVGMQLGSVWTSNGARYAALGILFLLSSLFIMIPAARFGTTWRNGLVYLAVVQVTVIVAFAYRFENARSPGPEWYPKLVAAAHTCRRNSRNEVAIPTTPSGWLILLPCTEIRSAT